MAESQRTTFEEAKVCPKCSKPGEDAGASPSAKPDVKIHLIWCRSEDCEWYNTNWLVQVNSDGTVPEAYSQIGPKSYPKLSAESETRVREAIEAQLRAETSPGTEIINPFG
jgi:hypothetical protein